jgi:hypothetical protein
MSLTVNEGSTFKQVAPGTYAARCIKVIDLGTQTVKDFNDQDQTTKKRQVMITWELPGELIEDGELAGQPYGVSRFYTAVLSEKSNLRKDLEAWRGRNFAKEELEGFSLKALVGKPCMVSVVHSAKGKANVKAVLAVIKGLTVPPAINPLVYFDIDEDGFGEKFEGLTKGIKKIIHGSEEYQRISGIAVEHTESSPEPTSEDSIPF